MLEKQFKQNVLSMLKNKYGKRMWYFIPQGEQRFSIPDLICCIDGKFVAIEIKRPDKKINCKEPHVLHQKQTVKEIMKARGLSFISNDQEEIEQKVDLFIKGGFDAT